jgi:hypothetical protein
MQTMNRYWAVVVDEAFSGPYDGSWTSREGQTPGLVEGAVEAKNADDALDKFVAQCCEERGDGGFRPVVAYSEVELQKMLRQLTKAGAEEAQPCCPVDIYADEDPEAAHPPPREEDPEAGHPRELEVDPDAYSLHEREKDPDAHRLHVREEDPDSHGLNEPEEDPEVRHPPKPEEDPEVRHAHAREEDPDQVAPLERRGKTRDAIMERLRLHTKLMSNLNEAYVLLTSSMRLSESGKVLMKAIEQYMD